MFTVPIVLCQLCQSCCANCANCAVPLRATMDWMVAKDHPCLKALQKRCTQDTAIGLFPSEVTTRKRCFQVKIPSARELMVHRREVRNNRASMCKSTILTIIAPLVALPAALLIMSNRTRSHINRPSCSQRLFHLVAGPGATSEPGRSGNVGR